MREHERNARRDPAPRRWKTRRPQAPPRGAARLRPAAWLAGAILVGGALPAPAQPELWGFVEYAASARTADTQADPAGTGAGLPDFLLNEARVQLQGEAYGDASEAHFTLDFLADRTAERGARGEELILREGWVKLNLGSRAELRAGRQPATWGTGDLLFINDLFPKDYVSFFTGRDDAYLKSPVDALRLSLYGGGNGLDIVYTPEFSPDITPTGERLDFYAPAAVPVSVPGGAFADGEIAVRLQRGIGSWKAALYGYRGFWKAPAGLALDGTGMPTAAVHPRLKTAGASLRGTLRGGVAWVEGGWWESVDDPDGTDAAVPNSELQALAGYERSLWGDFTAGAQGFVQHLRDHAAYEQGVTTAFGPGAPVRDRNRWLTTLRLRQFLRQQTVEVSSFLFWSPTDEDGYLRLSVAYDPDDAVRVTVGANLFHGHDPATPFGMNDANDSVYLRTRMTF